MHEEKSNLLVYYCSPAFIKNPISRGGDWRGLCCDLQLYCYGSLTHVGLWQHFTAHNFPHYHFLMDWKMRVHWPLLFSSCHFPPCLSHPKHPLFFPDYKAFQGAAERFQPYVKFFATFDKGVSATSFWNRWIFIFYKARYQIESFFVCVWKQPHTTIEVSSSPELNWTVCIWRELTPSSLRALH